MLERLAFTPGRDGRIALLGRWFAEQPDPERGLGLAALTGALPFAPARPALLHELAAARLDPVLLALCRDYVGDLAETVALAWPRRAGGDAPPPALSAVAEGLARTPGAELPALVAGWLDALDAEGRLALLGLVAGGLRAGVSGRLARLALAAWSGRPVEAIEEVWHGVAPPYRPLFRWLEGGGERPDPGEAPVFRPLMLAHPLAEGDLAALRPEEWRAEWKWDGLRVQLCAGPGGRRIWRRDGEDISAAFPEIVAAMDFHATLDGELLALRDGGEAAPFADLQRRLNRRTAGPKLRRDCPVGVRLYDLLFDGAQDLRALPFDARRARLEAWIARVRPARMDLSPQIAFASVAQLAALRAGARDPAIEGLMLKRADSPYVAGRVKGLWWKWKRAPRAVDAVLMYAGRGGAGAPGGFGDCTFGLWRPDGRGGEELVPVGKAHPGGTDEERLWLERWIRAHTVARFGPVREVEKALVLEVAFDAVQRSARHKAGVVLRAPRILRVRRDKPAEEADRLEALLALAGDGAAPAGTAAD
nr:cisplatin damage response ATP-dependent DNA ligase [Caldovatus aquaticus]